MQFWMVSICMVQRAQNSICIGMYKDDSTDASNIQVLMVCGSHDQYDEK